MNQPLDERLHKLYNSLLGGVAWLLHTRDEIAVYVHALQRHMKAPQHGHAIRLNRVVKWVKKRRAGHVYRHIQPPVRLVIVSDAAFRKEDDDGLAVKGVLVMLISGAQEGALGGDFPLIESLSAKQRRVVRSTFAAELNALLDALELGRLILFAICEIMLGPKSPQELKSLDDAGQAPLPLEAVIDAQSIFTALSKSEARTPQEDSLKISLLFRRCWPTGGCMPSIGSTHETCSRMHSQRDQLRGSRC